MVEHSPKVLASKEKATITITYEEVVGRSSPQLLK